jgi:hypothetical protein
MATQIMLAADKKLLMSYQGIREDRWEGKKDRIADRYKSVSVFHCRILARLI